MELEPVKKTRTRIVREPLNKYYNADEAIYEIGVDEAGRGPLFGRVYAAAVILPKDDSFDHDKMKDSKLFHSQKKIKEAAECIKSNAIAYSIEYSDEKEIDSINILQATQNAMHKAISNVMQQLTEKKELLLLVDGNYFNPMCHYNKDTQKYDTTQHLCIEGGDAKYTSIAAASILAKVERDEYITQLCSENPDLNEKYDLLKNNGYGTKKHLDGIKLHGITQWHRKSFGICKQFV
jgi:ribonuclease HII